MKTFLNRNGVVAVVLLLVVCGIALWLFAPPSWAHWYQVRKSERLIEQIEEFRSTNGRLPTDDEIDYLKKVIGLPSGMACPCYNAMNPNSYFVWFGLPLELGSSYTYDSVPGEWREGG